LWHVPARSRRPHLASSLRSSRRGLSAQRVSRPRYTRHFSGLFFCPSRAPAQCSCQTVGASRSQHRLSSFLLHSGPIMDHVAVWCGLTPSTIGDCFSSPVHQYFTRSFKESVVFRPGLTCIRVWWGEGVHAHPKATSFLLQVHGLPILTDGVP